MADRLTWEELPVEPRSFWIGLVLAMTLLASIIYVATSGPLRTLQSCDSKGGFYDSQFNSCKIPPPAGAGS